MINRCYSYCMLTIIMFIGIFLSGNSQKHESLFYEEIQETNISFVDDELGRSGCNSCPSPCSRTLVVSEKLKVLCKTILEKKLLAKKGIVSEGKLRVDKNATFKQNVLIKGMLSVTDLVVENCIDNLCVQTLSVTDLIVGGSSCIDNLCVNNLLVTNCMEDLCVQNLSAIDVDISGTLSVEDAFIENATIQTLNVITSVIDSIIANLTITGTASINDAVINDLTVTNCMTSLCVNSLSIADVSITGTLSVEDQIINGTFQIPAFNPAGILHNNASGLISSSLIVNADVSPSAAIVDTKLATISTVGKVANSATTATSSDTASAIVRRDGSGNFATNMITIDGAVTNPTDVATKAYVDAAIIPTVGTNLNIPDTLVERDNTGSFAAQVVSVVDTVLSGNITLGNSLNSTTGNVFKNTTSFIHNYGTNNTFVGANAGNFTTSGMGRNSAFGVSALLGLTSGTNNIAIGYQSGQSLTTGSGNVYINANAAAGNENSTIRIGTSQAQCFVAGITAVGVSGDVVVVDANGQLGITLSSERFKHDIQDIGQDSESIFKLRPVTFIYNNDNTNTKQYGLIAEEADEVLSEIVVRDRDSRPYTIRYQMLPILLLKALQNQQKIIIEQQGAINELQGYKAMIHEMKNIINGLEKRISAMN